LFLARWLDAAARLLTTVAVRLRSTSRRQPVIARLARPTSGVRVRIEWPPAQLMAAWRGMVISHPRPFLSIALLLGVVIAAVLAGPLFAARPLPVSARASRLQASDWASLRAVVPQQPPGAPVYSPAARAVDTRDIQRVLNRYRDAFSVLDAAAVKAVWPGADAGTLALAFDKLAAQNYDYDHCRIVSDGLRAEASCRGVAEYRHHGTARTRTDSQHWQFTLRKEHREWRIQTVGTQRDAPVMTTSSARR
jgi:hypothetical protein